MKRSAAEILREYGPFPGADRVNGVTFDGKHVWFASGDRLNAFDPASGKPVRTLEVGAHAGTAFDGKKAMAAEALGISRKNLWEKLKAHGIGVTESGALIRVAGEPSASAGVP